MAQQANNAERTEEYNHQFSSVDVTEQRRDEIVVKAKTDRETYEYPVPTGEYAEYGEVEIVFAHENNVVAGLIDDGVVYEGTLSEQGIEDVTEIENTMSAEALGAEVVYDDRPVDVQQQRRRDTELEYIYDVEGAVYCLQRDYIHTPSGVEEQIEEGAPVARIDYRSDGRKEVWIGEYSQSGSHGEFECVDESFTLDEALEVAAEHLRVRDRRMARHGRVQPALYVCPESAGEETCYAVRQGRYGDLSVDVVNAEKAISLLDNGNNGTIVHPNLDDDDWDELFAEMDVDMSVDELSCHPFTVE